MLRHLARGHRYPGHGLTGRASPPHHASELQHVTSPRVKLTIPDAALADLLGQYPDEGSATWAYTRALAAFRRRGAGGSADAALREALTTNPFVPAYLLGLKKLPRQLPAYVGFGDENEAVAYIAEAAETWLTSPQALAWLATVVARDAPPPAPARLRRPRRP